MKGSGHMAKACPGRNVTPQWRQSTVTESRQQYPANSIETAKNTPGAAGGATGGTTSTTGTDITKGTTEAKRKATTEAVAAAARKQPERKQRHKHQKQQKQQQHKEQEQDSDMQVEELPPLRSFPVKRSREEEEDEKPTRKEKCTGQCRVAKDMDRARSHCVPASPAKVTDTAPEPRSLFPSPTSASFPPTTSTPPHPSTSTPLSTCSTPSHPKKRYYKISRLSSLDVRAWRTPPKFPSDVENIKRHQC